MKVKTVILYSSVDGQTLKICNKLREIYQQNNEKAELISIDDFTKDVTHYDRLIIGASIRYGVHNKKIIDFINTNKKQLGRPTTALAIALHSLPRLRTQVTHCLSPPCGGSIQQP